MDLLLLQTEHLFFVETTSTT